jgi:hypothetical protein
MKTLEVVLEGLSSLSFSKQHMEPMLTSGSGAKKESHAEHDERTWRSKMHTLPDGRVYIPPMALKQAIEGAAKYNPVKKRGTATWTKTVEAAVLITDEIVIEGLKADDVKSETIMCNSDGKPTRYSRGSRVPRIFPVIPSGWRAKAKILVLDESIPNEVVEQHLVDSGVFVGIGRWRAENRGLYGRYRVVSKKWS